MGKRKGTSEDDIGNGRMVDEREHREGVKRGCRGREK